VVKVLCYKSEGRWFNPRWCHLIFFFFLSFRLHYGPGVDSASNRNEYQEYFLGGRCGWCIRLTTLPSSCAIVKKSGNLNFLEPSGPLQACNGTALPLPFTVNNYDSHQNAAGAAYDNEHDDDDDGDVITIFNFLHQTPTLTH
jgi:hypothetical protein